MAAGGIYAHSQRNSTVPEMLAARAAHHLACSSEALPSRSKTEAASGAEKEIGENIDKLS
jgi:hypothetical protein